MVRGLINLCALVSPFEQVLLPSICGRAERCPIYSVPDQFILHVSFSLYTFRLFVFNVQLLNMRPGIEVEEN